MAKKTVNKTIRSIISKCKYNELGVLDSYDFNNIIETIGDEELISNIIEKMTNKNYPCIATLDNITEIFKYCIFDKNNQKDMKIFKELIDLYFKNVDIFMSNDNFKKVSNAFNEKTFVLEYFRYLIEGYLSSKVEISNINNISLCINYIEEARQYFLDDRAQFSAAINLINSIDPLTLASGSAADISKKIEAKLDEDKKGAGIYSVDSSTLAEMDKKIKLLELSSDALQNLIEISKRQAKKIQDVTKKCEEDITDVRIKELEAVKLEANKFLKEYDELYRQMLAKEKETLISERDTLLSDINIEIQKKKSILDNASSSIDRRIAYELSRIRSVSNDSIDKVKEFINNDETVKKMLSEAKSDDEFVKKISQIALLPSLQSVDNATVEGSISQLEIPSIYIPSEQRIVDPKINYYFDKKIPFTSRFNQLMELKQKDIEENGAIYHEKFNHLLTMVLENDVPYMYGPSGCGKTFMVQKQLAKLLGIDVVTSGYILYEQDVLGYTNSATGNYVPSNFYRCYKFGDMIFLDELDNGIANATVVLNSFVGGRDGDRYTFPSGETVSRHSNFRIISAGNTSGNGRTVAHNTRQKLDESVMQRLTPIEIDYDNRIEERILKDYPDWYNFSVNFREAIKNTPHDSGDGPNYTGTITTRDVETIRKYKSNNSFTDDDIITYQVIENKDIDTLTRIQTELEKLNKNGKFDEGGKELLKKYKVLVDKKRG